MPSFSSCSEVGVFQISGASLVKVEPWHLLFHFGFFSMSQGFFQSLNLSYFSYVCSRLFFLLRIYSFTSLESLLNSHLPFKNALPPLLALLMIFFLHFSSPSHLLCLWSFFCSRMRVLSGQGFLFVVFALVSSGIRMVWHGITQ